MKLIVGLGNPGKRYERTRHNAGFWALDTFARALNLRWTKSSKHNARIAKGLVNGASVMLVKPTTFMNLSGDAVQSLTSYTHIPPQEILVVHDEMDLTPGRMSFKRGGGDSGHNGIASIIERLGTNQFARLRIGIGRPTPPITSEDWVLGKIDPATLKEIERAPDAIQDWIALGTERAMNQWNRIHAM